MTSGPSLSRKPSTQAELVATSAWARGNKTYALNNGHYGAEGPRRIRRFWKDSLQYQKVTGTFFENRCYSWKGQRLDYENRRANARARRGAGPYFGADARRGILGHRS